MTFTPAPDFTPAQHIAAGLYKVVEDSFRAGLTDKDEAWLGANEPKAAKLYRFHNAMTWFWADQLVQQNDITSPAPDEFMGMFRESVFTRVLGFFPGMAETDGGKVLWGVLFDDDDKTPDLINEVAEAKPPYFIYAVGRKWLAVQGIDIDGQQQQLWMRSIVAAGGINEKVKSVLGI